jgi:hypothetical protein
LATNIRVGHGHMGKWAQAKYEPGFNRMKALECQGALETADGRSRNISRPLVCQCTPCVSVPDCLYARAGLKCENDVHNTTTKYQIGRSANILQKVK